MTPPLCRHRRDEERFLKQARRYPHSGKISDRLILCSTHAVNTHLKGQHEVKTGFSTHRYQGSNLSTNFSHISWHVVIQLSICLKIFCSYQLGPSRVTRFQPNLSQNQPTQFILKINFFKKAQKMRNTWLTFVIKIVIKIFKKLPNLVTMSESLEGPLNLVADENRIRPEQ